MLTLFYNDLVNVNSIAASRRPYYQSTVWANTRSRKNYSKEQRAVLCLLGNTVCRTSSGFIAISKKLYEKFYFIKFYTKRSPHFHS
ncbi:hypothetical protein NQ317_005950 [Molorchus minor]|uniref:Uncharacterized protein n=1 Tax=Molorchus minor TaxID=1323400 RepID=A0ABQ9IR89_9CUCU|nr:hypothetical protein NQ317_005950 [Molorchus minor]